MLGVRIMLTTNFPWVQVQLPSEKLKEKIWGFGGFALVFAQTTLMYYAL